MNTLWQKVWADLWLTKSRTALAIVSIAVGVCCVGTLFGMIDLLLGKMDAAHRQSQPSHINLILRHDADISLLEQIKAIPGVAGVDTMTPLSVHFRQPGETDWHLGTLIIRPDYEEQHFDKTALQSGNWPSGDQIAIENLSALSSDIQSGNIEFETALGPQTLPIGGIVRHPFVKPPKFGGQVHFFASVAHAAQFGIPAHSFRQLLVQIAEPYSSESARNVAGQIRSLLSERHIGVNVTLLQDPQQHWGRPFLAGINGVLQIMALVSLTLASVLILNTVSAHITQQTDQIGVMKALGAKTITIAKLYLLEILFLSLVAIILAIPPALAAAYFSACRLLGLFNIDCGAFVISVPAVAYMLLGGLLAPLLAGLPPILRGAAMTVRAAIASYGVGADFGYNRFDLLIEKFGARFLPTLSAAALGNLFRRKARLVLTQSVLICAGVMFLVLTSLIASLNLTLDREMARSRYAVRLGFTQDQSEQTIRDIAAAVAGTGQIEFWQRSSLQIAKEGQALQQKGSLGLQLLALPKNSSMYQPLIESGRWLQTGDAGQRVLVLSADTAELNGIRAGDMLDVALGADHERWQVIGIYRWLAGNSYTVEPAYAPLETLRQITQNRELASFALLNTPVADLHQEADYLRNLQQQFQEHGIQLDVYTTLAKLEQRQFTRNQFKPVLNTLLGLACMIAAVGGIGLSGTLAISVLQRIREIGVLRAIGAPSQKVFRMFLLEGLLHGGIAWLLSIPLAYLAAEPLAKTLGRTMLGIQLDFRFDLWAILYWLLIVLTVAWIAAFWPARKATRLSIRECLGH
ncbi:FtsX-like permease family protein [Methylomonas sp. MO1]|uniref:ABC transporter permease n=1 Tax=Methylomonas sp. MO1 TaxID=3073619 RepID=UPI0028A2EF49|nr:FtsX-like permease family protein [Methylomonas sp. MO1]MDT4290896.1 FtsX-like permease family protein [Methylomonas sp. MO1]